MIPVFISLQVSVARVRANYDQLPLSSLTDDAPQGEIVNERYNLPKEDMTENKEEETLDFDIRERSCFASRKTIICSGSKFVTAECRKNSHLSCHSSILTYGSKKCKEVVSVIPKCGRAYITGCECA